MKFFQSLDKGIMWWCNILGDKEGSISYILWFDPITEGYFILTSNIIFLKEENPEPILTVKIIEWRKFIDYFGLSIEANPTRVNKKNLYLPVLGLHQALHLDISIYQGTSWTKSCVWNHQSYFCTN